MTNHISYAALFKIKKIDCLILKFFGGNGYGNPTETFSSWRQTGYPTTSKFRNIRNVIGCDDDIMYTDYGDGMQPNLHDWYILEQEEG